ncbi:hypothetical protein BHM03_00032724 [Ensete ventricosum]|nr:hypothetical protein BHM03_00032724 [Ensete ventricosum]
MLFELNGQSALTGESLPVTKGPGDGVYSGSTCKQGEIEAVVIATGVHTFFGKAAHLVDSTNQVGHFQKVLSSVYTFLEHKYEIVKRLQARKHICGMTGDGVNDAPALKKADIGIAVADATDAARSASDIVLTEPGLSVIISAVLTSRAIFQRMKNYTVSCAYDEQPVDFSK